MELFSSVVAAKGDNYKQLFLWPPLYAKIVGWKSESKENGKERMEDGLIRKVERS